MKYFLVLVVFLVVIGESRGQTAPAVRAPKVVPVGYEMTRRNGDVYLIKRYVKEGLFYVAIDVNGKKTSHLIESIASMTPLDEAQFQLASSSYKAPDVGSRGLSSVRISARTSARTSTRASAAEMGDPAYVDVSVAPPSRVSAGRSSGYRTSVSRSGGYYIGPRQPAGHYAGGQGSSHKGGHYMNSHTGNHYQKRK